METAIGIQALVRDASRPVSGTVATVISVVLLVVGSTSVFAELQAALDRIWRVPVATRRAGWWLTLRARLLSFGLILGLAFLMMVSLVVSAAVAAFAKWANDMIPAAEVVLQAINIGISLTISSLMFAMIYKFMHKPGLHGATYGSAQQSLQYCLRWARSASACIWARAA